MFVRGDLDLNAMQAYTGSLEEVLKKTMLNQEVIFKNQVHELHHLYRIQKTLMQNLGWKEFGKYNFRKASTQSTLLPCASSTRDEPMDLLEGWKGIYDKIQPNPPDLQLPSDQCVSHIDPGELTLSLSIREDNRRKGGTKRTWFDVKAHSCSQNVIDLEELTERMSHEGLEQSPSFSSAPITNFRGKHDSEVSVLFDPIISSSVKKNLLSGAAESNPFSDDSEWNPFNQGLKKSSGSFSIDNLSTRRQQFSSYKVGFLDLNKIQHDDSSCLSNDPTVAHPSTASSLHAFCGLIGKVEEGILCFATGKEENKNYSNETSDMCQKDDSGNFVFRSSNRTNERKEYLARISKVDELSISEMGNVGLEAVSEAVGCHNSDPSDGNDGFILELPNSQIHLGAAAEQVNHGNNRVEDPVFSYSDHSQKTDQDAHGTISSAACKPCSIGDNDSSSVKTMQSEFEFSNSDPFSSDQASGTHVGSQVSESLMGVQDQRFSDSSESKHKYLNKEEESDEMDILIREAAEALFRISLESSSCRQDCAYKVGGSNKMKEKESEQPQYSDFFELMTLKLTESSVDDHSLSSKPSELNYTENKDFGFKLRRGRRMKDFQKDILPGLASLSRHEIREDINILEGVLRSREYKKLNRMAGGHSWCAPVRNKRSRLNHVGRRKSIL